MSTEWEWDETLFAGAAPYYEKGRLPYAPGLADSLRDALGLDGRGRLLDVGCGPGTVALRVAHLFEEVVGLDADAGMLAEAERLAAERGVANARWVHKLAEELPAGLGRFRVITFAASFHWMKRERVAGLVREMLDPEGVLVHVDSRAQEGFDDRDLPYPPLPATQVMSLIKAYLGPDRRAGRSIRNSSPGREDLVFRGAGFAGPELVVVPDGRVITPTIDEVVWSNLSASYSAPHLFGERLPAFEADLRALLWRISPGGKFAVRMPDNELKIWRPS